MGCLDKDMQNLSVQGNLLCIENGNCIRLNTVTKLVGFAGATLLESSTGTNASSITIPYSFNVASIVPQGVVGPPGNDTRDYLITFSTPHPNGDNYIITNAKPSDEPTGDERKIQFTNKTPTSFIMKLSIDDNGGVEDPQVWSSFDFVVYEELELVTGLSSV